MFSFHYKQSALRIFKKDVGCKSSSDEETFSPAWSYVRMCQQYTLLVIKLANDKNPCLLVGRKL